MDLFNAHFLHHKPLEMDELLRKTIGSWWDHIDPYYQQVQDETTWKALPSTITAAFKYLGCDQHSLTFINIFRIAYFANFIHASIKDAEEGQAHDRAMQFSILIGDMLFGRLLQLLVEADHKKIMMPFAEMICTINEGRVMRHKMDAATERAVGKIYAPFYGTVFLTAAIIADRDEGFCKLYRELGLNLGMTIELINAPGFTDMAGKYLDIVRGIFTQINQQSRLQNSLLEKLIIKLCQPFNDNGKTAVV